jgi:DNA-binding response OmpR family regulator
VILVADDDTTMREVLKLSLETAGFDCRMADDGVLACSIARKSLPDAIVLDVNMPRLDGFQVLYCLRSMWSTRKIPVLLLTARTDQQGIRRGAELGAEGYMTKPFEVSDLLERVQRLIAEGKAGARGL